MDRSDLNQLLKLTPDLICVAGTVGYFDYLNEAWEKALGYTLEELLSRPLWEWVLSIVNVIRIIVCYHSRVIHRKTEQLLHF